MSRALARVIATLKRWKRKKRCIKISAESIINLFLIFWKRHFKIMYLGIFQKPQFVRSVEIEKFYTASDGRYNYNLSLLSLKFFNGTNFDISDVIRFVSQFFANFSNLKKKTIKSTIVQLTLITLNIFRFQYMHIPIRKKNMILVLPGLSVGLIFFCINVHK